MMGGIAYEASTTGENVKRINLGVALDSAANVAVIADRLEQLGAVVVLPDHQIAVGSPDGGS